ncbi:MAG: ABC transporter permease [Myxococcota bacterium]
MRPSSTPRGYLQGVTAVVARNLIVWRAYAGASVVGNFGEPVLYLVALGFGLGTIVRDLGGMSYAEFIAPGLVVSTVMYTATFEMTYGAYTRLTVQSTYDALLATPITISELVAGELVFAGIKSLVGATCVLIVVAAFGLAPAWSALGALPLAFAAGVLFAAMALAVTSVSRSYEFFNYYFTLVIAPMFLFSGIFFPLAETPRWAQGLALVLPLTHVVAIVRPLVRGTFDPATAAPSLLAIVLLTATSIVLCQRGMRRRLSR